MKRIKIYILSLFIILTTLLLISCSNSQLPSPTNVDDSPPVISEEPEQNPEMPPEQIESPVQQGFLEVVYFHTQQRCVTCLCFEDRVTYVIDNYFDSEIKSGKLVYKIINISDDANAQIVERYNAFASQLFINKIIDNKDNITDIVDIWKWKCPSDKSGFDAKIKSLIEQSLSEIET